MKSKIKAKKAQQSNIFADSLDRSVLRSPLFLFFLECNQSIQRGRKISQFFLAVFFAWNVNLMFSKQFLVIYHPDADSDKMLLVISDTLKFFDLYELRTSLIVIPLLIFVFLIKVNILIGGIYFLFRLKLEGDKGRTSFWPRVFGIVFSSYFWLFFIPNTCLNLKTLNCLFPSISTLDKFDFCENSNESMLYLMTAISLFNLVVSFALGGISCILTFKIFGDGSKDYMSRLQFSFNILLFLFTCFLLLYKALYSFPELQADLKISRYIFIPAIGVILIINLLNKLPFFKRKMNFFFLTLCLLWPMVTIIQILTHILHDAGMLNKIYSSLLYLTGIPIALRIAVNTERRNHTLAMNNLTRPGEKTNNAQLLYAFSNLKIGANSNMNSDKNLLVLGMILDFNNFPLIFSQGLIRNFYSERQQKRILIDKWKERIAEFKKSLLIMDWEKKGSSDSGDAGFIYIYKSLYLLTEAKSYAKSYIYFKKSYERATNMGEFLRKFLNSQVAHAFKTIFAQNLTEGEEERGIKLNLEKFLELEKIMDTLKNEIQTLIELNLDFWKEQTKLEPELRQLIDIGVNSRVCKRNIDQIYYKLASIESDYTLYKNHVGIIYGVYKLYLDFDFKVGMQLIEHNYKLSFIRQKNPRKRELANQLLSEKDELRMINRDDDTIEPDEIRGAVIVKALFEDNDLKKIIGVTKNCFDVFGVSDLQFQEGGVDYLLPNSFIKSHKERLRMLMTESDAATTAKKRTYFTIAKHSAGHLFPVKKHMRISPDIEAGFHFLALFIPNRKEYGTSFILCDGHGNIDSCSSNLLEVMNLKDAADTQKLSHNINLFSKEIGSMIKIFQVNRENEGAVTAQVSQFDLKRLKKFLTLNKTADLSFENGKFQSNLIKDLSNKATGEGFIVKFGIPKRSKGFYRNSTVPSTSKEKILKSLNIDSQTYKQSLTTNELTKSFASSENGENSFESDEKIFLNCNIDCFSFSNKKSVFLIKLRPPQLKTNSGTQRNNESRKLKESGHDVSYNIDFKGQKEYNEAQNENIQGETEYIEGNDLVDQEKQAEVAEVEQSEQAKEKLLNIKRLNVDSGQISKSSSKKHFIENAFEQNDSENRNDGLVPMRDKFYVYHQMEIRRGAREDKGQGSSSMRNSSSTGRIIRKSRAIYTAIRKPAYPRLLFVYSLLQIAFISVELLVISLGYSSSKQIFDDTQNLVGIVRESENRQAAIMDVYRRTMSIRNFITGFGTNYRNLSYPQTDQIQSYIDNLEGRVKNFLAAEFLIKDFLNNRNEVAIMEYENRMFEVKRFTMDKHWIDKSDLLQFSKKLAESGARVSRGPYTQILGTPERAISLKFIEANLLNGPLQISMLLSKKIFDYMIEKIEDRKSFFLQLFYLGCAILVLFFFVLIITSSMYLKIKLKQATLLIFLDQQDSDIRKVKLSEMLKLFMTGKDEDQTVKNVYDDDPAQNLIKKSNKLLKSGSTHRRAKSYNANGISMKFHLIVVACILVMVYILIFHLLNYSMLTDYYRVGFVYTNRMRVVFERSYLQNILGISLIGLMNSEDLSVLYRPAEEEFLSSLKNLQTQNPIYEAFLYLRDDENDHTFEDLNTRNYCLLFAEKPCFDPELISNGWIHFENSYSTLINNIYSKYTENRNNRKELERIYDSYDFLYLESALTRGRTLVDSIRVTVSTAFLDRIQLSIVTLNNIFVISVLAFAFYLVVFFTKQLGFLRDSFINIRYVFSLVPPENIMKNKLLMSYFINTTQNESLKRIFKTM